MGDHGIFEPLFDPEISGDDVIDRMEHDNRESVERHLRRAAEPHKLLIERFVEEWPDTVAWVRNRTIARGAHIRARAHRTLGTIEDRMLRITGKVIDATHKAQMDRREAAKRMGYEEYGRPAVHVIGKYMNPVFRQLAKWRHSLGGTVG